MAARIYDFNFDPQFKLAVSDAATLLAMHNFCLDNLKATLEKVISNKKVQDQLNDNNDLMNYMVLVLTVMEEFQLRIIQNFYHNKELEENEFLQKQIQEGEERLDELNRLFAQVIAIHLAAQKIRELEYTTKNANLENDLKKLNEELRQAILNVGSKKAQLSQTNQTIEKTFDTILNNISNSSAPIEFAVEGKTLRISQNESKQAIKNALQEDFDSGTFTVEGARPKVKNAFIKLGMEKLTENYIEHTQEAITTVDKMAETQTNKFMDSLQKDINSNKLNNSIQQREIIKSELNKAEETVESLEVEVKNKEEEIVELRREYNDVVSTIKEEVPESKAEMASSSQDISEDYDDLDDDPFAQIDGNGGEENQNELNQNISDYDEFPAPPGSPDNDNYPNQPPPSYSVVNAPLQQSEPSAPPQEEVDYPAPSAPAPEEAPMPSEPSPVYVGRNPPAEIEQVNNIEAKIEEPQPANENKPELKNQEVKPSNSEVKEIKSSRDILGRLGMDAESLRKDKEKRNAEALLAQTKKNNQPTKQDNINEQKQQNEPIEQSEMKSPGRRKP